jgi:hypothetical protein
VSNSIVCSRVPIFERSQAVAQVGRQQRLARDLGGAGQHHVGEFRHREGRLADVGVADIVGEDVDGQ